MQICSTCSTTFSEEPLRADDGFFCSEVCLPEGALDELHAISYVGILESYRDYVHRYGHFSSLSERDEALEEIAFLRDSAFVYFAENPGHFYIRQIHYLHDRIYELYDRVFSYFGDLSRYEVFQGLHLTWHNLPADQCDRIIQALNDWLTIEERKPHISYNDNLNSETEYRNIISFPDELLYPNPFIEALYEEAVTAYGGPGEEMEEHISLERMAICPSCRYPEPLEEFTEIEELKQFVCEGCSTYRW
ncbi:hypothetical protein QTL97_12245 [Sporosarcina thermotolerans]|uniref:Uncharacterized protein n=2 Tax=Sporosarcina thermotolerans TaxID=633404 RepID=A0AAW9ADJ6_9BACL|nr:hypothetical protein [Sporosarcina thermotolerans]MDW0117711.1 hypothetical protein [Sporosarcina thermotolerans]WHT49198.1 hypothetical protein QNH10_06130 [Sporosarcina thermotolerans]